MPSSKLALVCNVIAFLLVCGVIAMQMMEAQAYTGSLFGFFQ